MKRGEYLADGAMGSTTFMGDDSSKLSRFPLYFFRENFHAYSEVKLFLGGK